MSNAGGYFLRPLPSSDSFSICLFIFFPSSIRVPQPVRACVRAWVRACVREAVSQIHKRRQE